MGYNLHLLKSPARTATRVHQAIASAPGAFILQEAGQDADDYACAGSDSEAQLKTEGAVSAVATSATEGREWCTTKTISE